MKGLDPHDPRPMLVIFAGVLLITAWRVLSSITLDGVLALAEPLAPLALGALAIASALAMQRLLSTNRTLRDRRTVAVAIASKPTSKGSIRRPRRIRAMETRTDPPRIPSGSTEEAMATETIRRREAELPETAGEVVASLAQHRVLCTAQVRALHFPDNRIRWTQSVLARLRDAGLVEAVQPPRTGRRLWFATERGVRMAREAHALEATPRPLEGSEVAGQLQAHTPKLDEHGRPRRPLNATSINKTLKLLQWVLSIAVEYEHIDRNPAEGRRRRLPEPKHAPVHLDTVEQIQALLDACALLDRSPKRRSEGRVAVISTLLFAGPRAEELCNLLWRDVDLANGRIHIGRSKTQAGLREIDLLPVLRDTLATHKANAYRSGPDDLVFPTATGGRRDRHNLRSRTLGLAIKRADELLAKRGQPSLPRGLTTHKLRHTFASILVATGEDPASVMAQLGHAHPAFTLRVYTHLMRRGKDERARLKALVQGKDMEAVPSESRTAEEAGS